MPQELMPVRINWKNPEEVKKWHDEYNKRYHPIYYAKNRKKRIKDSKKWQKNNLDNLRVRDYFYHKSRYDKNISSWIKILPNEGQCGICGVKLLLITTDKTKKIHFDHRNGGNELIKIAPSTWLSKNPCSDENVKIWISCDFGILCCKCNLMLPTKNRSNLLKNAVKYVFGKDLNESCL